MNHEKQHEVNQALAAIQVASAIEQMDLIIRAALEVMANPEAQIKYSDRMRSVGTIAKFIEDALKELGEYSVEAATLLAARAIDVLIFEKVKAGQQ